MRGTLTTLGDERLDSVHLHLHWKRLREPSGKTEDILQFASRASNKLPESSLQVQS